MVVATRPVGRSVQKVIHNSLVKAKPKWNVVVPKQKYRNIADLVVKTNKHNILIKVQTKRSGYFRFSMFSEEQLNAWGQHHRKAKNNLALLFFYFAEDKTLVSVDIDTLLNTKLNKLYIEDIQSMG